MPRLHTSDIAHTAITDHRILRRPDERGAAPAPPPPLDPGANPLLYFHKSLADPYDPEVERDLGLALVELARKHGAAAQPLAPVALPYLQGAVHRAPDDLAAWEAKGFALLLDGHRPEALDAYDTALAAAPGRERSLTDAAELATLLGRQETAIDYWRRDIGVNPWAAYYHGRLAQLLAERLDWQGALAEAEAALRLNPNDRKTRLALVRCYLGTGRRDRARAELETLVASHPADAEVLRRWFAEQAP
jgi:tetratricopeptide (TPR) repeat protein